MINYTYLNALIFLADVCLVPISILMIVLLVELVASFIFSVIDFFLGNKSSEGDDD